MSLYVPMFVPFLKVQHSGFPILNTILPSCCVADHQNNQCIPWYPETISSYPYIYNLIVKNVDKHINDKNTYVNAIYGYKVFENRNYHNHSVQRNVQNQIPTLKSPFVAAGEATSLITPRFCMAIEGRQKDLNTLQCNPALSEILGFSKDAIKTHARQQLQQWSK